MPLFHSGCQRHSPTEPRKATEERTLASAHKTQESISRCCYIRDNKGKRGTIQGDKCHFGRTIHRIDLYPSNLENHPRSMTTNILRPFNIFQPRVSLVHAPKPTLTAITHTLLTNMLRSKRVNLPATEMGYVKLSIIDWPKRILIRCE